MTLLSIGSPVFIVVAMMIVVFAVLFFAGLVSIFFPWLQAFCAAAPVSMFSILGMRLRRIPVKKVIRSLIMAKQAGISVSCREMESAYLQGVDLEKVTLAMIHAKREGLEFMFDELVEADLADRLEEKLIR